MRKIQAKDLALLPAERKQPQIDKQIKILHMLEKKQDLIRKGRLASIYGKNTAAVKSKQVSIAKGSKYCTETFRAFYSILSLSISKVSNMLPVLGSFKRQISKTGKLNKNRGPQKG